MPSDTAHSQCIGSADVHFIRIHIKSAARKVKTNTLRFLSEIKSHKQMLHTKDDVN